MLNYDGKTFVSVSNTSNGEVDARTRFQYHQRGHLVWATYEGGAIEFGTLVAIADADGCLKMNYQHITRQGTLMTGQCTSAPEILPDNRIRLHEKWQWTSGDHSSGTSVIEEVIS